jgi:glycolate oxidase iron-sulfur subunit
MAETPAAPASDAQSLVTLADRCVQCGLCLPHCPTYQLDRTEAESPRGRIAYIKATAGAVLDPTETGDRHLDHCLGCLRCEAVCPAGVEYDALLIGARARQFERRPPPLKTRLTASLLARPALLRNLSPLARAAGSLPRLPVETQRGVSATSVPSRGQISVFIGCVAGSYEQHSRRALVRLLAAIGYAAHEPTGQTCCGTAAAHLGDRQTADALAARNRAAFSGDPVLSLATGCQQVLAQSLFGHAPVFDAVEFLEREGATLRFRPAERKGALHLPCTQRVAKSDAALRRLLARVPGLGLVELPDTGCCGAAGLHMVEEPQRAGKFRAPLIAALQASGATELLSANIGCRLHLANGTKIPVRHPIDFLAEHLA